MHPQGADVDGGFVDGTGVEGVRVEGLGVVGMNVGQAETGVVVSGLSVVGGVVGGFVQHSAMQLLCILPFDFSSEPLFLKRHSVVQVALQNVGVFVTRVGNGVLGMCVGCEVVGWRVVGWSVG